MHIAIQHCSDQSSTVHVHLHYSASTLADAVYNTSQNYINRTLLTDVLPVDDCTSSGQYNTDTQAQLLDRLCFSQDS